MEVRAISCSIVKTAARHYFLAKSLYRSFSIPIYHWSHKFRWQEVHREFSLCSLHILIIFTMVPFSSYHMNDIEVIEVLSTKFEGRHFSRSSNFESTYVKKKILKRNGSDSVRKLMAT